MVTDTFSNRKALIIGGSGGIGRAVALGLAASGAELIVHGGSSQERLDSAIAEIREIGGKAEGFLLYIDSPSAAERILARCPAPDILVCAWGPFRQGPLEETGCDFWQAMAENNLIFPGILVSLALKGMIKQNYGRILLFGGTNTDTIKGYTTTVAYSAAKTALGVIAKSAAKTAGAYGVTCNVVCPGLTETEYTSEDQMRYYREKVPGGIPMRTEQIARAALEFLGNPCLNGAIAAVDQGVVL